MWMNGFKTNFTLLTFSAITLLVFAGCGETGTDSIVKGERTLQASAYINKGNFVEVASYAYKRATDASFTKSTLDVNIPGSSSAERVKPSTYNISTLSSVDKLQKVIMQNHENRLEVRLVGEDKVNILLQASSFTIDHQMSFAEFSALR